MNLKPWATRALKAIGFLKIRTLTVAHIAPHVFEPFAARFAVRRAPASELEAAFMAGQQHVLAALKEGIVHEVR